MGTLTLTFQAPITDSEDKDQQMERILHLFYKGLICAPLEARLQSILNEGVLAEGYKRSGMSDAEIAEAIQAMRRMNDRDVALMRSVWETLVTSESF